LTDIVDTLNKARDVLHMDRLPSIPLRRVRTKMNRAIAIWLARFGGTLTAELSEDMEFARTDKAVQAFSGGEAVRLAVAFHLAKIDLLAGKLPLLILDEPTHNLDIGAQAQFCDIIRQLQTLAGQKLYIVIVTHEESLLGSVSRVVRVEP
jgi:DNA repair exonuclease SbcCD ATPase subunit